MYAKYLLGRAEKDVVSLTYKAIWFLLCIIADTRY